MRDNGTQRIIQKYMFMHIYRLQNTGKFIMEINSTYMLRELVFQWFRDLQ